MNKNIPKKRKSGAQFSDQKTINRRLLNKQIVCLKEQLERIRTLEVIVTVVGTMKAGKSTCINTIVGREILPNRSRPMTSLPTLVRHKAGCHKPMLYFAYTYPVQRLIGKLGTALNRVSKVRSNIIDSSKELANLATRIRRGFTLKERYRGEIEIFSFLRSLNDLVRLAEIFNIDFPFDQFTELESFPLIEVEFTHLGQRDVLGHRGNIALLDTPGANEAGQSEHLRKIVKDQLQRANAVLAVIDYTQLKSESEAELIAELRQIAEAAEGRIFALVNKFDCRSEHSDNAGDTIDYVSRTLLDGIVPADHVFPVSAAQAFLAQRARSEMLQNQSLNWTESKNRDWRDDFGRLAFGSRYARFMNDTDAIHQAIEDLWAASMFEKPLEDIVHYSQISAVKFAVDSTLSCLQTIADLLADDGEARVAKLEYI